jgi:glycerate 2-kinase
VFAYYTFSMPFIKNSTTLATSDKRKVALTLLEAAFSSIQPKNVLENSFFRQSNILKISSAEIDLDKYKRVFMIGFGKGSAGITKIIEQKIVDKITDGYIIDATKENFTKLHFTLGTHPLPSEQNITFTNTVLENIQNLTEQDLVLIVICGGGSAMFEAPYALDLPQLSEIFDKLLKSGADITEMNVIRKHLSKVKGGGLAKHLFPAKVVSMIFSDVPGNNLSTIASGPTVKNDKTMEDVHTILQKFNLPEIEQQKDIFTESPLDDKYFANVSNVIMLSNQTALHAIEETAKQLGYPTRVYSDKFQGEAKTAGKILLEEAKQGEILLAAGETTVKVKGNGKGGRNQTLVLSVLPIIDESTIMVSVDSDGWDFYHFAGAVGDKKTVEKAKELGLDIQAYLDNDDSFGFFDKVGDGIWTDRLESNVADIMMVLKI